MDDLIARLETEQRLRVRIVELERELAEAKEALRGYGNTYCEGWCEDGPHFEFADCGGCPARKALAKLEETP